MALPDVNPACPEHDAYMVAYTFQAWELSLSQEPVSGFRCPNLICPIVYVTGALEGFYSLEPNGDLIPYTSE